MGEKYEGELMERVSTLEPNQINYCLDEIGNILIKGLKVKALKENETYGWLAQKEREKFRELINNFYVKINNV